MGKRGYLVYAHLRFSTTKWVVGTNNGKTHPLQKRFALREDAIKRHAEIDALVGYLRRWDIEDLKHATMDVKRMKRDGTLAMGKPCSGCQRALYHFGVKKVTYTNEEGEVETLWQ